ncbi:MAG: hypothetical protein ACTSRC_21885 [Candidatus Helarchaeota archaeon]
MEAKITITIIHCPKNRKERLVAAINSSYEDLYPSNGRVVVTGKNTNGEVIYLGEIDETVLYQKRININEIIDVIRFGEWRK